jgi:hypothetical protein
MSAWLFLLNVVLISRLPLLLRDKAIAGWNLLTVCAAQEAALLVLKPSVAIGALAASFAGIALVWLLLERRKRFEHGGRLVILFLYFIAIAACWAPLTPLFFRNEVWQLGSFLQRHFAVAGLEKHVDWTEVNILLFGFLLCIAEANLLVRCLIGQLHLDPQSQQHPAAAAAAPAAAEAAPAADPEAEYNRGRVIGVLERLIVFALILRGEYGALGFVIAAKSFARFKELNNRNFAEYFLVGTLASVTSAGAIAFLSQAWIKCHENQTIWDAIHALRWQ